MSAQYPAKSSSSSTIVSVIVGLALMAAGTWYANQIHAQVVDATDKVTHHTNWDKVPGFVGMTGKLGIPVNLGETVATIGVFLVLLPVINLFFINPLMQAIEERNRNLETTFSDAENLRSEMGQLRNDYEARLVATEASAREQIQNEVRNAQELRRTLTSEAAELADRMKEQATQQIEAERNRVMTELRTEVVDLSLAAATKVVRANMNTDANRRLVQDFVADLEDQTPVAATSNVGQYAAPESPASGPEVPPL